MKFKTIVEYEYPIEHKPPIKAEIVLHGDRVVTDNIKWIEQEPQESEDKCKNCEYYRNPDYTRCHECKSRK